MMIGRLLNVNTPFLFAHMFVKGGLINFLIYILIT